MVDLGLELADPERLNHQLRYLSTPLSLVPWVLGRYPQGNFHEFDERERYTAAVDRKKLAASGMAKIEART
ncbi:MAG: hypothetical protein WB713_01465 [Methyloceanibacter sp.]